MWNSLLLIPPATSALSTGTSGQLSRLTAELAKSAMQFRQAGEKYTNLIGSCFDADRHTLNTLRLLRIKAELIESALRRLIGSNASWDCNYPDENELNCCNRLTSDHLRWAAGELAKLTHQRMQNSPKLTLEFLLEILTTLLRMPSHYPRFCFQSLQRTIVKIKVSPQPQGTNRALNVVSGQELVLSVEGLVQSTSTRAVPIRSVARILISVSLDVTQEARISDKEGSNVFFPLTRSVIPHNDYFSGSFVISLPMGLQTGALLIRAEIIDKESERVWNTGVFSKLRLNVIGGG